MHRGHPAQQRRMAGMKTRDQSYDLFEARVRKLQISGFHVDCLLSTCSLFVHNRQKPEGVDNHLVEIGPSSTTIIPVHYIISLWFNMTLIPINIVAPIPHENKLLRKTGIKKRNRYRDQNHNFPAQTICYFVRIYMCTDALRLSAGGKGRSDRSPLFFSFSIVGQPALWPGETRRQPLEAYELRGRMLLWGCVRTFLGLLP